MLVLDPLARLLRLFHTVVADGLTPATWDALAEVPEFGDLIGARPDADTAAADHYDLFSYRVHPHASLFLDDSRTVGGPVAEDLTRYYREAGFTSERSDLAPDHLSTELAFLAWTLEREQTEGARSFVDSHLAGWLPSVVRAVRNQPYEAHAALAEVLGEIILSILVELGGSSTQAVPDPLPPHRRVIDDPEAGVRHIARYLTTPAQAGFFIGRGDVSVLARTAEVPRGMGSASLMMENALKSASHYGTLSTFVAAIDSMADDAHRDWAGVGERIGGPWPERWISRIEATRGMMQHVAERLAQ